MTPDDTEHAGLEGLFTLLVQHETAWPGRVVIADPDLALEAHATKSHSLGVTFWTGQGYEIRIRPAPLLAMLKTLAHETGHIKNCDVHLGRTPPDLAAIAPLRAALVEDRLTDFLQAQGVTEEEADELDNRLAQEYILRESRADRAGAGLYAKWLTVIPLMAEELKRIKP